ncbi:unnamed protein product [Closterium sp. Yama58-4]|nr:unnamed protein product [Closterium sp. Yama58-4]
MGRTVTRLQADVADEGATGKVHQTAFQNKHGRPVVVLSAGQQNTSNHAGQEEQQEEKGKQQEEKGKQREEKGKQQEEKGKQQEEKGKQQEEKGKQQEEKGNQQEEKGKQQEEKGKQQEEKGKQQEEKAKQQEEKGKQQKEQEQMVWLKDFHGWWSMRKAPPLKTSREVLSILQSHYLERLGTAVIYNPPAVFEAFWKVIRPFIGHSAEKTAEFWRIVEGERLGQQQEIVGGDSWYRADSTQGSEGS